VTRELDQSNAQLSILIDVRKMRRPVNFVNIRATQTFMDHRKLQHIYVAASDRLVKLSMIVIFNLGKAYLHMFDDLENATLLLQRQLESTP
jgi:chromosome condensin MukBEF MukE localization factor